MVLVTLAQAKGHLRISTEDSNDDIYLKMEQASAIVVDYLKARLIAIESVSIASPTVITTEVPHSLVSGSTYTIGGTTTTPTVNGAQVVTVTGLDTFTVPVAVAAGQSAAAGTVGTPAWTTATAPLGVVVSVLLVLTHLWEHRGDDTASVGPAISPNVESLLVRHRDPALA